MDFLSHHRFEPEPMDQDSRAPSLFFKNRRADQTMLWFRWYHGTISDPKWRLISKKTGEPVAHVVAVWAALLENASESQDRGTLQNWNDEVIATALDLPIETVGSIIKQMQDIVLSGETLNGWKKRQPKREREDDSYERVQHYRERVRQAGGSIGGYLRHQAALLQRDEGRCVYCHATVTSVTLCIDHILPVSQGGEDDVDNLAMSCRSCNSGKSGRTPEQAGYEILHLPAKQAYTRYLSRRVTPLSPLSRPDKIREEYKKEEHPIVPQGTFLGSSEIPVKSDPSTATKPPFEYHPEFLKIWSVYPRHTGKGSAFKAWTRARKNGLPPTDRLLEILEKAKVSKQWIKDNGQFIPMLATWLNGHRWDDDYEPARKERGVVC